MRRQSHRILTFNHITIVYTHAIIYQIILAKARSYGAEKVRAASFRLEDVAGARDL